PIPSSSLSLHDALPIWIARLLRRRLGGGGPGRGDERLRCHAQRLFDGYDNSRYLDRVYDAILAETVTIAGHQSDPVEAYLARPRSEEHTSELQSRENLV